MSAVRVEKWGDGLAVRLPRELVDSLGLKEGDEVRLSVATEPVARTAEERAAALAGLHRFRGMVPADFEFDRDEIYDTP
jgi:antitoxin MazE